MRGAPLLFEIGDHVAVTPGHPAIKSPLRRTTRIRSRVSLSLCYLPATRALPFPTTRRDEVVGWLSSDRFQRAARRSREVGGAASRIAMSSEHSDGSDPASSPATREAASLRPP